MATKKEEGQIDLILQKMIELSYYQGKGGLYTTLHYNGPKRSVMVNSQEYINYITTQIYRESGAFVSEKDIKDRLKIISCELIEQNCCEMTFPNRYAYDNGVIYINMSNEQLQYIEVTEEGFETVECDEDTPLFVKNPVDDKEYASDASSSSSLSISPTKKPWTLIQVLNSLSNVPSNAFSYTS